MARDKRQWEYEFAFILSPNLEKEKLNPLLAQIKEAITKAGGKLVEKKEWGVKPFAYKIANFDQGLYLVWAVDFTKSPDLNEINLIFNREQDVLRYLWVKRNTLISKRR